MDRPSKDRRCRFSLVDSTRGNKVTVILHLVDDLREVFWDLREVCVGVGSFEFMGHLDLRVVGVPSVAPREVPHFAGDTPVAGRREDDKRPWARAPLSRLNPAGRRGLRSSANRKGKAGVFPLLSTRSSPSVKSYARHGARLQAPGVAAEELRAGRGMLGRDVGGRTRRPAPLGTGRDNAREQATVSEAPAVPPRSRGPRPGSRPPAPKPRRSTAVVSPRLPSPADRRAFLTQWTGDGSGGRPARAKSVSPARRGVETTHRAGRAAGKRPSQPRQSRRPDTPLRPPVQVTSAPARPPPRKTRPAPRPPCIAPGAPRGRRP